MTLRTLTPATQRLHPWLLASIAACAAGSVQAAINNLDDPELFVVVWDPVKETSYVKDLGLSANSFSATGQQDAGYQQFWKFDTTDAQFKLLRDAGTAIEQLQWAVLAIDTQNDSTLPGDVRAFHTLRQGPADGVVNPVWQKLVGQQNSDWFAGASTLGNTFIADLNNATTHSTHGNPADYAINGSSYAVKGEPAYFAGPAEYQNFSTVTPMPITNAVGKSSWFYTVTDTSFEGSDPVQVDEFDNLEHDGYWGLAQNPADGSFALSYTLQGIAGLNSAQREFAQGIGRTEFSGAFSTRRLAGAAAATAETGAGFSRRLLGGLTTPQSVSPVPEPQRWALMLAGLAAVAGLTRRRGA